MFKRITLITFITLFSIGDSFSQDVNIEDEKRANKWLKSIELTVRPGVSLVQDKFSPSLNMKVGFNAERYKIHLVGLNNYYFSSKSDDSRKRNFETYFGLEFVSKGFADKIEDKFNTEEWWQGIGISFCPKPFSDLHLKKPFKVYWIMDFGGFGVTTGYVFSDFFYPEVSIRFGF